MSNDVQSRGTQFEGTSLPPARIFGDSSTITLVVKRGRHGERDRMDGRMSTGPALNPEAAALRVAVMPGDTSVLTITVWSKERLWRFCRGVSGVSAQAKLLAAISGLTSKAVTFERRAFFMAAL